MEVEWNWKKQNKNINNNKRKGRKKMKYGEFGGQYVSQELKKILEEVEKNFKEIKKDRTFKKEYLYYLRYL